MRPTPGITVRFTVSEMMALLDIIIAYMRHSEEPQEFIDCSRDVTTTPGELLLKILSSPGARKEPMNEAR